MPFRVTSDAAVARQPFLSHANPSVMSSGRQASASERRNSGALGVSSLCGAPVIASLARNRVASLIIFGAAAAQLLLTLLGLPGWTCPLLHATGAPCPGCGLSRAVALILRGEWRTALSVHLFAPFVLIALAVIGTAAFLTEKRRQSFASHIEKIERRTFISTILLAGLVAYWLVRLLFFHSAFVRLIQGAR